MKASPSVGASDWMSSSPTPVLSEGDDGGDLEALFAYCRRWLDGCRMIDWLGVGLIEFFREVRGGG
jgi:hypothetical protein